MECICSQAVAFELVLESPSIHLCTCTTYFNFIYSENEPKSETLFRFLEFQIRVRIVLREK